MLALALSGPACAQTGGSPGPGIDRISLQAFSKAFTIARRLYIEPVSEKTLLLRAVHGLDSEPDPATPEQKRIIAFAISRLNAAAPENVVPMLQAFGNLVDALHATGDHPAIESLVREAVGGMLDGLDPQTRLLPLTPAASTSGEASAGLMLRVGSNGPRVIRAYAGSPAARAGIQPGDDLIAVDGHLTKDLSLESVSTMLRGATGSSLTLLIGHNGVSAPVEITRAVIRIPLISGRAIGSIAYLRINAFAPEAAKGLRQAFVTLQSRAVSPLSGVVLDLRDNTGGRLNEAIATADELLPPTTLIATTKGRDAAENQRFTAASNDMTGGLPMVVLVNDLTGAGSEIVAAALQKGRGAVIMGSHTAGAGRIQTVFPLQPLGSISVTTAQIVLGSGQALEAPGVLPQVALMPRQENPSSQALETPGGDPLIVRLRRGLSQTPEAGEPFDAPETPERDFEVKQASAALVLLQSGSITHP